MKKLLTLILLTAALHCPAPIVEPRSGTLRIIQLPRYNEQDCELLVHNSGSRPVWYILQSSMNGEPWLNLTFPMLSIPGLDDWHSTGTYEWTAQVRLYRLVVVE